MQLQTRLQQAVGGDLSCQLRPWRTKASPDSCLLKDWEQEAGRPRYRLGQNRTLQGRAELRAG